MPERRWTLERIILGISALFVLGGLLAFGLGSLSSIISQSKAVGELSTKVRGQIILISSLVVLASFVAMLILSYVRHLETIRFWCKTMADWEAYLSANKHVQADVDMQYPLAGYLSEGALQELARSVYLKAGCRVVDAAEEGSQIRVLKLLNPLGHVEIVTCVQMTEPVDIPQVCRLKLIMDEQMAVRGCLWAPGGFLPAARRWAKDKGIFLVDDHAIDFLVRRVGIQTVRGRKQQPGLEYETDAESLQTKRLV
jgi:Restriction endonuclease